MRLKALAGAAVMAAASVLAQDATAATFSFLNIANGGAFTDTNNVVRPGGEANWNTRVGAAVGILDTASGISVAGSASTSAGTTPQAYFDRGAGLGVCSVFTAAGQCNPSNDDNVGAIGGSANAGDGTFEILTLTFNQAIELTNVTFRAEGHGLFTGSLKINGVVTNIVGGLWSGSLVGSVFNFEYIPVASTQGSTNEFYIDAATADLSQVPVPAAGLLLVTALGGLSLARRRKAV